MMDAALTNQDLATWDRDHFLHPSTAAGGHARGETPARVIAGGKGAMIWDTAGRRSLDAFAGLYCVNVGYGQTKVAEAIAAQLRGGLAEALAGHAHVGEVRGDGLIGAVEFVRNRDDRVFFDPSEKVGPRLATALLERGVIARAMPQGDILVFAPPLCLTAAEADTVVAMTTEAVRAVLG